jgi:hypothetical protein
MKVRLATMATVVVVVCSALGAMSTAASARPLLCEKSGCGGKGAQEYSEKYVHECKGFGGFCAGFEGVVTYGCMKNTQYGAQWDCWGEATEELEGVRWEWHMWVGEYGGYKHALWEPL